MKGEACFWFLLANHIFFSSLQPGDLYFKAEKMRGWSGVQPQSISNFEKIRTVGKGKKKHHQLCLSDAFSCTTCDLMKSNVIISGAYGAAVLYRKKDDDSLVILKEISLHELTASERQMAMNEVLLVLCDAQIYQGSKDAVPGTTLFLFTSEDMITVIPLLTDTSLERSWSLPCFSHLFHLPPRWTPLRRTVGAGPERVCLRGK